MKILMVVDIAYEAGGAEKSVKLMRDRLIQQNHKVKILSTDKNARDKMLFADEIVPVISGNALVRLVRHFWYVTAYKKVRSVLRDFKPDIVHLHTISEFSPSLVWGLGNTPTVMTVHGPEEFTKKLLPWLLPATDYKHHDYQWNELRFIGRLRYFYYSYLQRPAYLLALRRLKLVIAPSKFMKHALESDFAHTPIKQLYNGIKLLPQLPLPTSPTVLYIGRLEAVKGVDHLIRSFVNVLLEVPNAKLRIVGDGVEHATLVKLTKRLHLDKTVEFVGWVPEKKISYEFQSAQLLAVPSVWPENLPTVAIEALAVGRAIVASDTGGVRELVSNDSNGLLVAPGDEPGLSDALCSLLANQSKMIKAAEASRIKSKHFDVDIFIQNLLIVYNGVLNEYTHS